MTSSGLEAKFALYWRAMGGPRLEREFRFAPPRRWPFDFAHVESKTAIEIEGGVWKIGRHQRPQGFLNDLEKYFEAQRLGWTVWRLSSDMITHRHLSVILTSLPSRLPPPPPQ